MARHAPRLLMLAVALAAPMLLAAPAFSDAIADGIAAIDPSVREIRIPGTWEKEGSKGLYRVVLARTAEVQPTARLFVQWLALGPDGALRLERSIEISELAALKQDVADFTTDVDEGLTVFVEMAHPAADAPSSYEIIVEDDGTYRFGHSSN